MRQIEPKFTHYFSVTIRELVTSPWIACTHKFRPIPNLASSGFSKGLANIFAK